MKAKLLFAVTAICLSAAPALAAHKISLADARRIALARVPGAIVHEKLKHEKPGKAKRKGKAQGDAQPAHDHYNIKIKPREHAKADLVKKVEIDAETGQILEVRDVKAKSYD